MKNFIATLLLLAFLPAAQAQVNLGKLIREKTGLSGSGKLTEDEVIRGLKEALATGSRNASSQASATDGYFGNPLIKIPFPPEAEKMESTLRNLGMDEQVDRFVLALNRAAEDAAKEAAQVFVTAITQMTVTDGMQILKGEDDAATRYLERTTSDTLYRRFIPIVRASMEKVQVTRYWNPLASSYNKVPFVKPLNPDLEDYVTRRAMEGLFTLVADEEAKIRKDPAARVTDLLKKVFGNQ
jgi:RNA binding exosome subunit